MMNIPNEGEAASATLERLKSDILKDWEAIVREQIRPANRQPTGELRDHVPLWLDELIRTLDPGRDGTSTAPEDPVGRRIGLHRASLAGYTLPIVMKEYALLRQTILHALEKDGSVGAAERATINAAIDNALALAGDEFASYHHRRVEMALNEARASNVQLESVAAHAAHDLKSPLTTMTAYLDQIERTAGPHWPASAAFIGKMRGQMTRLTTMIDRFMAYAALGAATPEFTAVPLAKAVRLAAENSQPLIEAVGAVVDSPSALPTLRGDHALLTQMFQNLIGNAVKFNRSRPPRVWVRARRAGERCEIEIEDNGIGIDMADADTIFEAHRRLRADEFEGSGLGLAIVKRIVDIHDGRITVHSRPGEGTTFVIDLPASRD